jgi:hypothetical protein
LRSYFLSYVFLHNAPPQQARELTTNFDPAAIVVVPEQPAAGKPTLETEMFVTPDFTPGPDTSDQSLQSDAPRNASAMPSSESRRGTNRAAGFRFHIPTSALTLCCGVA